MKTRRRARTAGERPGPSRRERRSHETRERLFRAALDLFVKKGVTETTVEDITEAADVGKGTFFNYFPSKEHILIAFADLQLEKLEGQLEKARHTRLSMPEFLREMAVEMTSEPGRNPSAVRAILQAYLSGTSVRQLMVARQNRGQELVTELMQLGQQRGEVRNDLPAAQIAQVWRQTIFGTLLMWSVAMESPLTERIRSAFDLLWNGLSPRHPGGGRA